MDDRGQTLHDYVAGISVFVLTVAVVLGLLPSVVAPFQGGGGAADARLSTQIGDRIVSDLSVAGTPNVLDGEEVSSLTALDESDLRDRFGLRSEQYVNLTLQALDGSAFLTDGAGGSGAVQVVGATARGEDAASSARVVRIDDPDFDCRPACRLVVRVW